MKSRADVFKKALLLLSSILLSLYIVEVALSFFPALSGNNTEIVRALAKKRGRPFDNRERWEVIRDLRSTGEKWYPTLSPTMFMGGKYLVIEGNSVIPLGGVANTNTLYCNESGYYTTYSSDEYGFHNPSGIWRDHPKFENAFVGDSFTNGSCVRESEGLVARVRQAYPLTVNLGATGNGPLSELATIREYLNNRELGHVFWMYFEENDLSDLYNKELKEPILKRYLDDDNYSQHLTSSQDAINSQLVSFVEAEFQKTTAEAQEPQEQSSVVDHLLFQNIKLAGFRLKSAYFRPRPIPYDLNLFREVMTKARAVVEKKGGKLVFVYLPEYSRYNKTAAGKNSGAHMKNDVINLMKSLGIEVIDIDAAFSQLDDPKAVFPFGVHNHYNAGGNLIIAAEIISYLNQRKSDKPPSGP